MIQKYTYGTPFETDAIVTSIPASEGTPAYGEKSAKLLLLHERKVYLTCFRQLNPSITS